MQKAFLLPSKYAQFAFKFDPETGALFITGEVICDVKLCIFAIFDVALRYSM